MHYCAKYRQVYTLMLNSCFLAGFCRWSMISRCKLYLLYVLYVALLIIKVFDTRVFYVTVSHWWAYNLRAECLLLYHTYAKFKIRSYTVFRNEGVSDESEFICIYERRTFLRSAILRKVSTYTLYIYKSTGCSWMEFHKNGKKI